MFINARGEGEVAGLRHISFWHNRGAVHLLQGGLGRDGAPVRGDFYQSPGDGAAPPPALTTTLKDFT